MGPQASKPLTTWGVSWRGYFAHTQDHTDPVNNSCARVDGWLYTQWAKPRYWSPWKRWHEVGIIPTVMIIPSPLLTRMEIQQVQLECHSRFSTHHRALTIAPWTHPAHVSGYSLKEQMPTNTWFKIKFIRGDNQKAFTQMSESTHRNSTRIRKTWPPQRNTTTFQHKNVKKKGLMKPLKSNSPNDRRITQKQWEANICYRTPHMMWMKSYALNLRLWGEIKVKH